MVWNRCIQQLSIVLLKNPTIVLQHCCVNDFGPTQQPSWCKHLLYQPLTFLNQILKHKTQSSAPNWGSAATEGHPSAVLGSAQQNLRRAGIERVTITWNHCWSSIPDLVISGKQQLSISWVSTINQQRLSRGNSLLRKTVTKPSPSLAFLISV